MALTRANVELLLVRRTGKLLVAADLDGVTINGTNPDLNDPIGWAIRQVGATVDELVAVDNDDVARVGSDDYDRFLDLAELRTLETIAQSLDDVDITLGPREEALGDLVKQVERAIQRKQAQVARLYGYSVSTLTAGVLGLAFQGGPLHG